MTTKIVKPYTKAWKNLNNKINLHDVVLHCALKAWFAKDSNAANRDEIFRSLISRAFTPITNQTKLNNGCVPFSAIRNEFQYYYSKRKYFGMDYEVFAAEILGNDEKTKNEFLRFFVDSLKDIYLEEPYKYQRRNYTYIFVDQEQVDPIYQLVQAAHVAMVIGQRMDKKFDAVNIHYQICKWEDSLMENLESSDFKFEVFYEPDVERIIAVGTHPIPAHKRGWLKDSVLLTFD